MTLSTTRRATAAASLGAGAALAIVGLMLQPTIPDDPAEYVEMLATSSTATLGIQLFVISQLFWAIGFAGLAHLAARRAPILATFGGTFAVLGAFGHAVYGGALLMQLATAADAAVGNAVHGASEDALFVPYMASGLLGTVVGTVLLAIAGLRSRALPRWVGIGLLAWVAVEFVLGFAVYWASWVSLTLGAVVFTGAVIAIARSDLAIWRSGAEQLAVTTGKRADAVAA